MLIKFNFRRDLFYVKCEICTFVFDPLWTNPFGGTLVPQGDLRSKNLHGQKVIRIGMEYFTLQIPNFQRPLILGLP
jgi:hypothetical protein